MKRAELANKLAPSFPNISQKEILLIINAFFQELKNDLIAGKNIKINGFLEIKKTKILPILRTINGKVKLTKGVNAVRMILEKELMQFLLKEIGDNGQIKN